MIIQKTSDTKVGPTQTDSVHVALPLHEPQRCIGVGDVCLVTRNIHNHSLFQRRGESLHYQQVSLPLAALASLRPRPPPFGSSCSGLAEASSSLAQHIFEPFLEVLTLTLRSEIEDWEKAFQIKMLGSKRLRKQGPGCYFCGIELHKALVHILTRTRAEQL